MHDPTERFGGVDWATDAHAVCVVDAQGAVVDEFDIAKVTPAPSVLVRAPRVAEAPVSMECRLFTLVPIGQGPGSATLVVGTVALIHVRDDLVDARHRVDIRKLRPIARLAGSSYAYVHDTFEMVRGRYNPATGEVEYPPA